VNIPMPIAILLWPLSLIYSAGARIRAAMYSRRWLQQKRLSGLVISVGNLTVGGTGKTPMVIWLAEKFLERGKRVAILSRGYRGQDGTSDEIELMKSRLGNAALFGVGKDRYAHGRRLEGNGVDIFILDDGFQHLQLARDVDVVLVDSTRPLCDEFVIPAGRLREPISALGRANAVVFTRADGSLSPSSFGPQFAQLPAFSSRTKLLGFRRYGPEGVANPLADASSRIFAFCGIGNPSAFLADLSRWGVRLVGSRMFRDHHRYSKTDAESIEGAAVAAGANALVTTEKDAQNIQPGLFSKLPLEIAVIALEISNENQFMRELQAKLALAAGVHA
jgi:tetraacyldisaccharide 4'-kinase